MAQENGLNWLSIQDPDVGEYDKNPYYQFFKKINHRNRFPSTTSPEFVGWGLLNNFPGQWINVASGFHEIGRGRKYGMLAYPVSDYSWEKFAYYSLGGALIKFRPTISKDDFLLRLARKYFDKLNLQEVVKLGYNPWDFVYWEDQSGGWLAQSYYNFHPIAEVTVLANCRRAIEIMWQIPDEYTNDSNLLYNCIMNEHDLRYREETMGKDFKPSPKDYDNYALVYGGYLLKGDPIEIAKRALEINPTIEWAKRALQNPNPEKK